MFAKSKVNYTEKFINSFSKLAVNRQLSALRDGFAFITPLLIIGALGVIFIVFVFGGWGSNNASLLGLIARAEAAAVGNAAAGITFDNDGIMTFNENSRYYEAMLIGVKIFGPLWDGTIGGALSIYTSFSIGYFYARSKNTNQPIISGLLSLLSFFIVTGFDSSLFGPNGSLVSIITAFVSIEIYSWLENKEKLKLKMPEGVPPAVSASFSKLFPLMIAGFMMAAVNVPFIVLNVKVGIEASSLGKAIYLALQSPFVSLAADPNGQLGIGLLFITLVGFFWFFGLHGSNILDGAVNPIWFVLLSINIASKEAGQAPTQAMAKGFWDAYVYVGGTGATLGLIIATFIFSKRKETLEIVKFATPAGIFQINEPVTFGYPMVLNQSFFLPYVFTMPILTVISWAAINWGLVPGGIVAIPWSTPIVIGAFLHTGSWQGPILALLNLIIAILIYIPFVLIYNRKALQANDAKSLASRLAGNIKDNKEKKIKIALIKEQSDSKYDEYIQLKMNLKDSIKSEKVYKKEQIISLELKLKEDKKALLVKYGEEFNKINDVLKRGREMTDQEYNEFIVKSEAAYNDFILKYDAELNSDKTKKEIKANLKNIKQEYYYNINTLKQCKIVDYSTIDKYYENINSLWLNYEKELKELNAKFDSDKKAIKKYESQEVKDIESEMLLIENGVSNG